MVRYQEVVLNKIEVWQYKVASGGVKFVEEEHHHVGVQITNKIQWKLTVYLGVVEESGEVMVKEIDNQQQ